MKQTSNPSYRITFNHVRDDSKAIELQFAEMELLGVPVSQRARLN